MGSLSIDIHPKGKHQMIRSFKERRDSEEGFTLIELMVVVLIIGILLAIAVPTFLNAQNNAKTKAATSNLRSSLSAVKTVYADQQTYNTNTATTPVIDASTLRSAEPSLQWMTGASTSPESISFVGDVDTIALANRSALGHCFYIIDDVSTTAGVAGTRYYKNTTSGCSAQASLTAPSGTGVTSGTSPKDAGW